MHSSLLDAYSVPSVAFVTYSSSLAGALFSTFFQLVKGPTLGHSNFQGGYTPLCLASFLHRTLTILAWDKKNFLIFFPRYLPLRLYAIKKKVGIPKIRIEIAICRFAAVKKLGTSVFLLPISISSRTIRFLCLSLLLVLTYSFLGLDLDIDNRCGKSKN